MHNFNRFLFKTLFLTLFFSSTVLADETNDINTTDIWISEAPPTVSILAGYLNIQNNSNETITLVSASSPNFSRIEIHRSVMQGEMVSMEKQDSLDIPAGETVKLSPGGYHLMLFNPGKPLRSGDTAIINLSFSNGHEQSIEASVKRRSGGHDHSHHNHH